MSTQAPGSALAHHLSVLDQSDEEMEGLPDEVRIAVNVVTEAARRSCEEEASRRSARVAELVADLECELDHPTAMELAEIMSSDIEAAQARDDEEIADVPLMELEEIASSLSGADPEDEESAAEIDGAIEAMLFAMKEMYPA